MPQPPTAALLEGDVAVPFVGAANATAVGGGLELLLACDVIVASSDARLGLAEVKRGLFPGGMGTLLGTQTSSIALEMTLSGESIGVARAYEVGLVNAVVLPGDVMGAALASAERIAANAPLGLAACKSLARLGVGAPPDGAGLLAHWQSTVFGSEDAKEGAAAFIERRPPVWSGR